jgi:hypothetical protein
MPTVAIPAVGEIIILNVEYASDGLSWARVWDNHCLGWLVDTAAVDQPPEASIGDMITDPLAGGSGPPPQVTGAHRPFPLILGSLAAAAPETAPVISPQWAKFADPIIFVPDIARLTLGDFLTWLATNNGARRPIGSMLGLSRPLFNGYADWAAQHPDLTFTGEPPAIREK